MQIKKLHSWDLSYAQARELQTRLASKVQCTPIKHPPRLIAGLDCALSKDRRRILAVAVVLRAPDAQKGLWEPLEKSDFEIVETTNASQEATFPYIPGLLSFREAPVCIAAVEKLKQEPDAFIIDGQGLAHPRRLGLAAHLGLFFDKPTIGCAKSRLTGHFEDPPPEKGTYSFLKDKERYQAHVTAERRGTTGDGGHTQYEIRDTRYEIIGAVVRTRANVQPVFVSVGNKCLLQDAIKVTLDCATKYRLPEPTRLAHQTVSKLKLRNQLF